MWRDVMWWCHCIHSLSTNPLTWWVFRAHLWNTVRFKCETEPECVVCFSKGPWEQMCKLSSVITTGFCAQQGSDISSFPVRWSFSAWERERGKPDVSLKAALLLSLLILKLLFLMVLTISVMNSVQVYIQ